MATYAIGDVQGCYEPLCRLLDTLGPSAGDELWFAGDLVNRGPDSLAVLRLIRSLGEQAKVVLGNHDLHLLAIVYGGHKPTKVDTFTDVLNAPDLEVIGSWYRQQPLLVENAHWCMTHAGVPHIWTLPEAAARAREVEAVLASERHSEYFAALYGNRPDRWHETLEGMDRWRLITNYFTRMRLLHRDGQLNFSHKGSLQDAPAGWVPWYDLWATSASAVDKQLVFGHWAAIEGVTGQPNVHAIDTGCVWGRTLTALCLETLERYEQPA